MFQTKYNKFKNKTCKDLQGNIKDSRLEAKHSNELFLLEKSKKIIGLKSQVRINFIKSMRHYYIADFVYYDLNLNSLIVFDSKGFINPVYSLKKDLILNLYNGFIFIEKQYNSIKYLKPFNKYEYTKPLKINLTLNNNITYTKKQENEYNLILRAFNESS